MHMPSSNHFSAVLLGLCLLSIVVHDSAYVSIMSQLQLVMFSLHLVALVLLMIGISTKAAVKGHSLKILASGTSLAAVVVVFGTEIRALEGAHLGAIGDWLSRRALSASVLWNAGMYSKFWLFFSLYYAIPILSAFVILQSAFALWRIRRTRIAGTS